MIGSSNYTVINEAGEWVVPVPVADGVTVFFFYLFKNPVTEVSVVAPKEYFGDKEEKFISFGNELYTYVSFNNLEGDYKLQVTDDITVSINGEEITGYYVGEPNLMNKVVLSLKPPLTATDLSPKVGADEFYEFGVTLTRQEETLTYSKLEYKREAANFHMTGLVRTVRDVLGVDCHLARMPNDFLIDATYQPSNANDLPEEWSLSPKPFIPLRARTSEVDETPIDGIIPYDFDWDDDIALLLEQKY